MCSGEILACHFLVMLLFVFDIRVMLASWK